MELCLISALMAELSSIFTLSILRPASDRNTERLYSNPAFFMWSAMMLLATWTLIAQGAFPAILGDCLSTGRWGDTAPKEVCNSVASLFLSWDCDSVEELQSVEQIRNYFPLTLRESRMPLPRSEV